MIIWDSIPFTAQELLSFSFIQICHLYETKNSILNYSLHLSIPVIKNVSIMLWDTSSTLGRQDIREGDRLPPGTLSKYGHWKTTHSVRDWLILRLKILGEGKGQFTCIGLVIYATIWWRHKAIRHNKPYHHFGLIEPLQLYFKFYVSRRWITLDDDHKFTTQII